MTTQQTAVFLFDATDGSVQATLGQPIRLHFDAEGFWCDVDDHRVEWQPETRWRCTCPDDRFCTHAEAALLAWRLSRQSEKLTHPGGTR